MQEVVIFDLKTLKVTGRVKTGQLDTDAIIYEPVTKHIFTFNGDSHNTTVIDAAKESVITTIDLVGKVEFPAVDGKGMVYDNNPEKNDIVAIDARTNTIKSRWPTAPEGAPTSMAIDQKNRRLFSGGRGPQFVIMMDADTGKVIQSYPISAGVDANAFEPATGMLFVATREGMLHIYHEDSPDKLSEVEAVKTEYGAKTLQVDPKTHNVFLTTSDFNPPAAPTEKQPHPLATAKPGNFQGAGVRALAASAGYDALEMAHHPEWPDHSRDEGTMLALPDLHWQIAARYIAPPASSRSRVDAGGAC